MSGGAGFLHISSINSMTTMTTKKLEIIHTNLSSAKPTSLSTETLFVPNSESYRYEFSSQAF